MYMYTRIYIYIYIYIHIYTLQGGSNLGKQRQYTYKDAYKHTYKDTYKDTYKEGGTWKNRDSPEKEWASLVFHTFRICKSEKKKRERKMKKKYAEQLDVFGLPHFQNLQKREKKAREKKNKKNTENNWTFLVFHTYTIRNAEKRRKFS